MSKELFNKDSAPEAKTPQQWILERPGLIAAMASQGAEGAQSALRIARTLMDIEKPKL